MFWKVECVMSKCSAKQDVLLILSTDFVLSCLCHEMVAASTCCHMGFLLLLFISHPPANEKRAVHSF